VGRFQCRRIAKIDITRARRKSIRTWRRTSTITPRDPSRSALSPRDTRSALWTAGLASADALAARHARCCGATDALARRASGLGRVRARAREAERDQAQSIEIPELRVRKTRV